MGNELVPVGAPTKVAGMALGGTIVAGFLAASFYLSALWLGLAAGAVGLGVLAAMGLRRKV